MKRVAQRCPQDDASRGCAAKFVVAMITVMLWQTVAGATAAREIALTDLTQRAELIVDADAGAAQSFRIDGRIYTRTTMHVRAAWKGPQTHEVSVITRGGVVDGIGQRLDGEAVLPTGTRAVLFLVYDERLEGYRTLALERGAYVIEDKQVATAPLGLRPTKMRLQTSELASFERQVKSYAR